LFSRTQIIFAGFNGLPQHAEPRAVHHYGTTSVRAGPGVGCARLQREQPSLSHPNPMDEEWPKMSVGFAKLF